MTEQQAIKRIKEFGLYHAIGDLPASFQTVEAFEMAIKALELAESLNKASYCANYQHERPYLVAWIDGVNRMLKKYRE